MIGATTLRDRIRDKALALGFDAVGFTEARLGPEARARLADFLASGAHGEMDWLAGRQEQRGDPRALWPEARSVVSLGLSYAPDEDPRAIQGRPDRGGISVYARNRDYHDVVKGMLKHLAQFIVSTSGRAGVKVFVDTAPVMEKPLAERAGLGWQGKHTNLVSRRHGSWLFLGEIYTTLELPPSDRPAGSCGSCTACLAACPTDAFPAPYRLDARRCISYLTIEHAGPIPMEFRTAIGNRIYGCDDCLAACPWNRFATTAREAKLRGARGSARAAAGRTRRPRRCRLPGAVLGLADQAHRPQPLRAQRACRDRQLARSRPGPGRPRTMRRSGPGGGGSGRLGGGAAPPDMTPGLVKRSLSLSGHRTSVALEPEFWRALERIASAKSVGLAAMVAQIDQARDPVRPLASALRVLALDHAGSTPSGCTKNCD